MDNAPASYLLGSMYDSLLKPSVKFSLPTCFNCPSDQGVGGLKEHTSLPALQPVPCPYRSCECREGHGHLVYKYT